MQYLSKYIWALIGKFLPQFVYLVTTMILARFLTPDDFGVIGVLAIFFTVANTLVDAGFGGSLIKEKDISRIDCSTIAVFNVAVSHILYFLLFFCSGLLERHYHIDGLSKISKIICLIFVINSWGLVPRSILTRDLRFGALTIIGIVSVVVSSVVSIVMASFGCGVWSLVAYQLVWCVVNVILSIIYAKYKISFRFSYASFKKLFSFGIYTTLTNAIDTVYENLTVNLFGKYYSVHHAGYLYQAKRIEEVPTQSVALTISSVSFPVLTKLRNAPAQFKEECNSIFKMVLLVLLPILAGISLFSEPIMVLLFGKQWAPAAHFLSLLIAAGVFRIVETLNRTFIKSTTVVDKLFIYTIIKRAIGIAIILCCIGFEMEVMLVGYIISTFIGYFINVVLLAKISTFGIIEQLLLFGKLLIPNVAYYVLVLLFMDLVSSTALEIGFAVLMLVLYYLLVLPLFKINLVDLFKQLANKEATR